VAGALAALGARVTLIAGPVTLPTPPGVGRVDVETACQMAQAVAEALPADAAVMVAAVADWRVEAAGQKVKKDGGAAPALTLVENPDILATVAAAPLGHKPRPVPRKANTPLCRKARACWSRHCATGTTTATGLPWRVITLV
jgi:phosphopantothenoylcysteine synthetase/decarboxylase